MDNVFLAEEERDQSIEAAQENREERARAKLEDLAELDFERDCGAAE